jgi:hypothetical protein
MPKVKISPTLLLTFIGLSFFGYIIYQYFPNKYQSITSFCVSDATLQQWSNFFQENDNKYSVRLLPNKSKPEQDLLFNSKQVRQIKEIKSINPTVELLYERNSNNKTLFYFYRDKLYTGTQNKCTNGTDSISRLTK